VSELQHPSPNFARAHIPFLNSGQEIILSIQSVNNASNTCKVSAGAPGLKQFSLSQRRNLLYFLGATAVALALLVPAGIIKLFDLADTLNLSARPSLEGYVALSLGLGAWALWFVGIALINLFIPRPTK